MIILRDYQANIVDKAIDILFIQNESSALIQAATGSGKTVIACEIIKRAVQKLVSQIAEGKKVLILVKQQTLLTQFHEELKQFGINASVLHAEIKKGKDGEYFKLDWSNPVQITMPTTFLNTNKGSNDLYIDPNWRPDIIIIDEAHKGTSSEFQEIRNKYNSKVLGLTASPYRENNDEGEHLMEWYGLRLITTISIKELIERGDLVQPEYIDFDPGIGETKHMVNEWIERAKDKLTIIFTTDTEESLAIEKAFLGAGIPAKMITSGSEVVPGIPIITGQTPNQRQEIFDKFERGEIKVLISCGVLCEGFNCRQAEVCIIYRNIGNHALYHQIIGRVLRSFPGKNSALVIDFRDNVKKYGRVEDFVWTISSTAPSIQHVKRNERVDANELKSRTAAYYTCHNCHHVYNIKRSKCCVYCNTDAQYKITTTKFKEIQKLAPNVINAKTLGEFKERFNEIRNAGKYVNLTSKVNIFNSMFAKPGQPIFNPSTYQLSDRGKYLIDLLNKRIDANQEYEVSID